MRHLRKINDYLLILQANVFPFFFFRARQLASLDEAKVFCRVASRCQQRDYLDLQTGKYVFFLFVSTEINAIK